MSLIGCSCMILPTNGPGVWKVAIIRAASQPLLPNTDLSQIRVLLEWCEPGGNMMGSAQREWVDLTNPEVFKCVYMEKSLLWARRVLPSEQNRAVAWPAKAFTFLCGTPVVPSMDMLIVEYFVDKDKAELHVQETKELQLSEAKAALSQQVHMLQELNEWEENNRSRELLQGCSAPLVGRRVSVCNVQQPLSWINGVITSHNLQTKEVTLMEDHSQSLHTVNPFMVHVVFHSMPEDNRGGVQVNQNGAWQSPPPLSLVTSPDVPSTNTPAVNSPHMTSPMIQECRSPHFNMSTSSPNKSHSLYQSPHSHHGHDTPPLPAPSIANYRRSSLQHLMRSEPNLHRRSSLDPATLHHLSGPFSSSSGSGDFFHDLPQLSHSLGNLPPSSYRHPASPPGLGGDAGGGMQHQLHTTSSPHGSNSQLSRHGSNPQLCSTPHGSNSHLSTHGSNSKLSHHGSNSSLLSGDGGGGGGVGLRGHSSAYPSFPTPDDIIKETDRSKSVGNLVSYIQTQPLQKHHHQELQQPGSQILSPPNFSPAAPAPSAPLGKGVGGPGVMQNSQSQKRPRKNFSLGAALGRKKPRFVEVLPTIPGDPQDMSTKSLGGLAGVGSGDAGCGVNLSSAVKTLSRSASQPAVFPPNKLLEKRLKELTNGAGVFTGGGDAQKHEDDLDILKQIIETDDAMVTAPCEGGKGGRGGGRGGDEGLGDVRSQSLTHIPGQFPYAGSLPSLHHAESMHVLHANYNSAPDFMQFGKPRIVSFEGGLASPSLPPSGGTQGVDGYHGRFGSGGGGGQEDVGGMRNLTERRRSSLYESHSAVTTPVLGTNSAQPTPAITGGNSPPFDFTTPQHGNVPLAPGFSGGEIGAGFGALSGKWNSQANGNNSRTPNTYQYTPTSTEGSVDQSGSGTMTPETGTLGRQERAMLDGGGRVFKVETPSTNDMLCEYLRGGDTSSQCRMMEDKSESGMDMLSRSLKAGGGVPSLPAVATEAVVLAPSIKEEDRSEEEDLGEFSISRVINRQFSGEDLESEDYLYDMDEQGSAPVSPDMGQMPCSGPTPSESGHTPVSSKPGKPKKPKKSSVQKENPRSRGRPRLSEEEKQRRKELRELGLMKRSKRRTKEQVAQWRAEKILTPAKRGRKPGSGKKNIVKTSTGKVVFVSIDLSQYTAGTVLLQNGFCRAYPGVSKCLDCGTCEGDFPSSKYCRFLEFRKLRVENSSEPRVSVYGFADYSDVVAQDLVPWTPLKTSYSGMDEVTALFILRRIVPHFMAVITEEAKTLPDNDVVPIWKRAVSGVRELCDTCDTSLFNFHWVCSSCGFCICPACYDLAYNSEDNVEVVSSMQAAAWPVCVSSGQSHRPSGLILAQIIPANVLAEVVSQAIAVCSTHKVQIGVPRVLQRLLTVLGQQVPKRKYQNEPVKKTKSTTPTTPISQKSGVVGLDNGSSSQTAPSGFTTTTTSSSSSSSSSSAVALPPQSFSLPTHTTTTTVPTAMPAALVMLVGGGGTIELPHSCSNGHEESLEPPPIACPHQWLCDGTLLCLLDAKHSENITAFQQRWRSREPVIVAGVDRFLDKSLWTPQAFERDFGEEAADLVDCRIGLHLLNLPSKTFWAGFEDMSARLRDPTADEPRLLKLKDWPPGDDFSEKLPRRFNDLMNALPLHEYTKREGRYNMASSLPSFFVKPDLGPKMYNAYGSPLYPHCGTTNLHLDISSAVNVMVYCSVPSTDSVKQWKLVEEAVARDCCPDTVRRIKETNAKPGAMWHIYSPSDSDKIRALLRKVYEERGIRPQMGSDPIHDQLVYLDSDLRRRLHREYGVKGWAIAQCVGDAVFIPAGAPHQVRNLCSCIKIAEDFVSPEHVYECLKLTEEFRQLSDRHANHEDKLQVKNIIYHSMKDVVGALKSSVKV